jgi:hypothetical protein
MSREEPNWEDVRWNYGAADVARGALHRAAAEIERLAGERARAALTGLDEWQGAHRETLNGRLRQADREDVALADDLRRAADSIARASQRARAEQANRERERREWERERDRRRRRPTNA